MRRFTLLLPLILAVAVGCGAASKEDVALQPEQCQQGFVVEVTNHGRYRADVFELQRRLGAVEPGQTRTFYVDDIANVSVVSTDRKSIFVETSCR